MNIRSTRVKTAAGLAGLALLAFPLAACGSEDDDAPAKVSAVASLDELANGKTTQVTLDPGFLEALDTLGLTPGTIEGAKLDGAKLSFPITGGNVTLFEPGTVPNYVVGQLQHENSGLSLEAGDIRVELRNFNVDPGVSRIYGDVVVNGEVAATSAYLFRLNGSTLKPVQMEGTDVILEGTKVFISDVAAGLLNQTFGTDAVTDQLLVGVAKITVATA
ncbi:MAG: hypothetical protein WB767_14415 [Nocardioides sp.]